MGLGVSAFSDLLRVPAGEGEVLQWGADGAFLLGTLQPGWQWHDTEKVGFHFKEFKEWHSSTNLSGLVKRFYPWKGMLGLLVEAEESRRVWTAGGSCTMERAAHSDCSHWTGLTGRHLPCCFHQRMRPSAETWGPPLWERQKVDQDQNIA